MHLCGPGEAPHIAGIASSRRPHDSRPRPFDSHCLVPATPANRLRTSYPTAPAWQHNRHAGHFRRCRKHPARESPLFHGAATCCGQVPLRSPHARPLAAACAAYDTDVTWTDRGLGHHGLLGNESRHREPRDLPPSPTISARGLANGLTPVIIPPRLSAWRCFWASLRTPASPAHSPCRLSHGSSTTTPPHIASTTSGQITNANHSFPVIPASPSRTLPADVCTRRWLRKSPHQSGEVPR